MITFEVIEKNKSKKLYQWDLDRQIKITVLEGIEIDEVHFAHQNDAEALVLEPKDVGGTLVADIPNILLQSSMPIKAWLMCGDVTVFSDILVPIRRAKPADYVYTETEILRYKSLEKRIKALEEGGTGGGIAEETDPTVPAWAKEPTKPTYTAEEVGAYSKEEIDNMFKSIVDGNEVAY